MVSERDFRHPLVGAVGARWPGRTVSADRPLVHVAINCDAARVDNSRPPARRSQSIEQIKRRVEIDAPAQCGLAFSESAGDTDEMIDDVKILKPGFLHHFAVAKGARQPGDLTGCGDFG